MLQKITTNNSFFTIIIFILSLIGFCLRIYHVDALPLWTDESVHGNTIANFLWRGKSLITNDNNGILYTFVSLLFVKFIGLNEFSLRISSVIFSTLSIPMLYNLGKLLFNKYVGLLAAILMTFSYYLVFWGRIGRHYAIFEFLYLLVLFLFWQAWHRLPQELPKGFYFKNLEPFFEKYQLRQNYSLALVVILFLCLLANRLTFFFVFSIGFYASVFAIIHIKNKLTTCYTDKYAMVFYGNILLYFLLLTGLAVYILLIFMPYSHIFVFLPSIEYVLQKWNSSQRYDSFRIYVDVLQQDYSKYALYVAGFLGFIVAFFSNFWNNFRQSAMFLFACFVLPFLLMSFVFNYMTAERYIIYVYPLFLLSISISIYTVFNYFNNFFGIITKNIQIFLFAIICIILVFISPIREINALLSENKYGIPTQKALASISINDWRGACKFVRQNAKPEAVFLSVNPSLANFYLETDQVLLFIQQIYFKGQFKQMPNDDGKTVNSYQAFMDLYAHKKQGWLIVDNGFMNYYVDTNLRNFILQNLQEHKNIAVDNTVRVFSWNNK